jgi:hypothetical protein
MADLPPATKAHFAQQHIEDAAKFVATVATERFKGAEENARTYERFYNNLALFSGGTIALSVTFLGYLKTLSKPIVHQNWLVASWVALFVCLAFSLFRTLFVTHYGHYSRNREYGEALKKKYETEAEEIQHLDIVNLQTPAERNAYMEQRRKAASDMGQQADWNKRRENFYSHAWIWSGRMAHLGFVVGLLLLLSFAIKNM